MERNIKTYNLTDLEISKLKSYFGSVIEVYVDKRTGIKSVDFNWEKNGRFFDGKEA